jgi:predicted heme/steroid binding protein
MADLIIKPSVGTDNKLIIQDQAGNAVLTTGNSGVTLGTVTAGTINTTVKFVDFPTPNLNVADGDGNTRSPIARDNKTWWYGDFGDAAGTGTYATSNVFTNVATGTNKSTETLPVGAESAARTITDNLGASYMTPSGVTDDVRTNFSAGDPWNIANAGMTMGCLFRNMHTGTSGKGVIWYGDNSADDHFFTRTNYGTEGLIQCGGDTDGTDSWIPVTRINTYANGWAFFVVAEGMNGSLHCSYNGSGYDLARAKGTVTSPDDAHFGLFSDLYNDNDSSHKYATCFWYEGVMSEELIRAEYRFLKNKWSNITDLP